MNYNQLTENERYQIYIMKQAGHTQEYIATMLERSPSTISRELARNQGSRGYRPAQAQRFTQERRLQAHISRKVTAGVRRLDRAIDTSGAESAAGCGLLKAPQETRFTS